MLNTQNIRSRIVVAKAAVIADPYLMDTGGGTWAVDADGWSATSGSSNITSCAVGGFADQKITASLKSSTAAGTINMGVTARFLTNVSGSATYYLAQQASGVFRVRRVLAGAFVTLASTPFTVVSGTWYTFILSVVGQQITASIDDGAGNSAILTPTDSNISTAGLMGFRSGPTTASQISCRSWTCEEV